ncbi:MAG: 3-hydroxyacyl-CoA dehydrogenase/enoyl-CoA hydratase family protein [Myxococcales bacterium]|nr:3-hydroxyacyl-CoA dehydrogenase/enoyl-CoA hydratase family protein [Myxococcales bacterium]
MVKPIRKVAVLGAGVMGSAIAAHLANVGVPSLLFDIVPRELTADEIAKGLTLQDPRVRNRLSAGGLEAAVKSKPAAFFKKENAALVTPCNFEDDAARLAEADWIVEAVTENLKIKHIVFELVEKNRRPGTPVTSNTSGLKISSMLEGRSDDFRQSFFVTHFFNPVRYMKLLEIIPGPETKPEILDHLVEFGERRLGKGIVWGKDTVNFVANRIGVYGMMVTMQLAEEQGMRFDEVDNLFGKPLGRPKSAVFRTADLVGLDTMAHVAKNCYDNLPDDEERGVFQLPAYLETMIERKWLGQKSKQGFFKKEGKAILTLDPATMSYVESIKLDAPSLKAAKRENDLGKRVKAICAADDRAGKLAWAVTSRVLVYAAKRLGEIADDIVNIDNGMKWGFNWEQGPFESWDAMGVADVAARLKDEGVEVPQVVRDLLAHGEGTFYKKEGATQYYWDFLSKSYKVVPERKHTIFLQTFKDHNAKVSGNLGSTLWDLGDGIAALEFHTKMNSIDDDIIKGLHDALGRLDENFDGLVIYNEGQNFSVGANLVLIYMAAQAKQWDTLEKMSKSFQDVNQMLKYSPKPVVVAPHQMALGGGCEVVLAGNATQAHAELYIGLVEVGVGLIPGAGGTKELLCRVLDRIPHGANVDLLPYVQKAFETIGMAKVATSAEEARQMCFLRESDAISFNRDHQLNDAKRLARFMADSGWVAPQPRMVNLPGRSALGAIEAFLYSMQLSGFISEHDALIGKKLGHVLTGGDTSPNVAVSEQHLLDLEREVFMSLCGEKKSQDRMQYMVMNNKPLRN